MPQGVSLRIPGRCQYAAHKLIVRHVFTQRATNPRMKLVGIRNVCTNAAFVTQNGGPFVCKVVSISWAVHQAIDQPLALGRIGVRQKLFHFRDSRQASRNVDGNSTNQCGIVTQRRRRNTQLALFRKHKFVDKRFLWRGREDGQALRNDKRERRQHCPEIAP